MENILLSRLLISSIMLDVGLSLESLGKVKLMMVYPQILIELCMLSIWL